MPAARTVFVTGTDTGVGKTLVATGLLRRARQHGLRACGYKPVASGAATTAVGLRNDDALALLAESPGVTEYAEINPYCFVPPIAPHLAAAEAGVTVDPARLDAGHAALAAEHELIVVEGAGGWRVPLDPTLDFADWVSGHSWPVILVVGLRLGCLNHALLSAEAIARRTQLLGWVANALPPSMARAEANIETLVARMPAPLLGTVPTGADRTVTAAALDLTPLLA